jgi:hypothetical protein
MKKNAGQINGAVPYCTYTVPYAHEMGGATKVADLNLDMIRIL